MNTAINTEVVVTFHGGPYAGQTRTMKKNPKVLGCVTAARAAGMHGTYKTPVATWDDAQAKTLDAHWNPLPMPVSTHVN